MNALLLLAVLTALFYLLQAGWMFHQLRHGVRLGHRVLMLALLPALLQAVLLHLVIDTPTGQNLGFLPIAAMVSWLIVLLLMIPGEQLATPLLLFALPLAAAFSLALPLMPADHVRQLAGAWPSLVHIFSALLAYSLLMVAAVQALLLWWLEQKLRHAPMQVSPLLPPLQLQESFLFRVISTGFGLLTLALLIAVIGMPDLFASQPLHKPVFAVLSWLVFAVLLFGRWQRGWRGRIAVRWTLVGFALLALSYAGTRIVLEYVLHRG
ncbi:cytochrome c biogenesis protein CcsA [Permianibacter sp. IMCC34836]|uniref:cytochrome C assembly family protein n=1 Tax=Permianibacter fluminis TaxID=2738515 RepID=UPI00155339C2|nr:cytochrome c biogenesis protein CcsA [Permianibacter fluminis]NQD37307.1 cytochrome c biogenesis protein CcsA [Permianibacter fluminis]